MNADLSGQQRERLFEIVLDTVSDGVTVIDTSLKIQYQNKLIVQAFGSQSGQYCYHAYRGRKAPCEGCIVLEVLKDGRPRRGVVDIALPGGAVSLVEISSAAIKDEQGAIIGAVEMARDVTEQKKAEVLLNKTLLQSNALLRRLNNELSDAAGYVKTVLPEKLRSGAILTDWLFIPSVSLGGDSFGYHWLDKDHFAFYLIDVSGHGWAAALLSVSVINVLRSQALPRTDFHRPEQVLAALNRTFPGEQHNDMFFSIWYGVYHPGGRKLTYSSGGHPPALLFDGPSAGSHEAKQLRTQNFIIGGDPDSVYHSRTTEVQGPARLFVFSDGVFDIAQHDGSIWGFSEFVKLMAQAARSEPAALDTILRHTRQLSPQKAFEDDYSMLQIDFQ